MRLTNLNLTEFSEGANGRGEANVFEPTQLSLMRTYRVWWKKQRLNLDELAKLYWEDGLTMAQIAEKLRVGRTTVRDNLRKISSAKGGKRGLE